MTYRRLNRRQLITRATGLALAGSASAGRARAADGQDLVNRRGGVPRIALPRYPDVLYPRDGSGWEEGWAASLVYDAPLRATANGEVVAGMVISVQQDERGTVLELVPRNNVAFSDGAFMTAADIAWSIEQAAFGASKDEAWRWVRIDSVEATPHGRVLMRLTERDSTLEATLASTLVPVMPDGSSVGDVPFVGLPPGTGPFLPANDDSETLRFRRNGWHWVVGQPRFGGLSLTTIEQEIERTTSLATGLVDVVPAVPSLDIPLLENDEGITLHGDLSRQLCALAMRLDREPLNDERVRRLVAAAIDRELLVESATAGTARAADWLFAPEHWAGPLDSDLPARLETGEIRDQLAALGLLPGWSLELICPEAQPALANAAIVLQDQFAAVGIAITVDLLDAEAMQAAASEGGFHLAMSYLPLWIDPHEVAYPWLHSEGRQNISAYTSARMDRTLALARSSDDLDQRGALYRDVQRLVATETPLVPLFATPWFDGLTSRIEDYRVGPPTRADGLARAWFADP